MSTISPSSTDSGGAEVNSRNSAGAATEGPSKWRLPKGALAIAALALAGAIVFFYPSAASWLSQYDQSKVVVDLESATAESALAYRTEALAAARAYNDNLVAEAHLPANTRKPVSESRSAEDAEYLSLLNGDANGAMGRLRIDSIEVDLPIYHGTDDATLEKGVGHLAGTSLPVGGDTTHSVLTAHRGFAEATLFDRLDELKIGDTFRIEVFGEVLTYSVFETKVVDPNDTESLYPRYDKDLVTLVTCTPLGVNSHRILVTAERVLPTPLSDIQAAGANPEIPGTPWWAAGLLGTLAFLALYVWRMGRTAEPIARRRS